MEPKAFDEKQVVLKQQIIVGDPLIKIRKLYEDGSFDVNVSDMVMYLDPFAPDTIALQEARKAYLAAVWTAVAPLLDDQ